MNQKKLFQTTLLLFIILCFCTISMKLSQKEKVLRTNLEIEDNQKQNTDTIYLMNPEGYLVKWKTKLEGKDKIKEIIHNLEVNNNQIPKQLNGYIPSNINLIDYQIEDDKINLNFSKELKEQKELELILTGITYSILENLNLKTINIEVEKEPIYQNLTKEKGINKVNSVVNYQDISQVTTYFLDKTNTYYVPVTKYINDSREKIEIIIEELKKTKKNLISPIHPKTELESYREEGNVFFLNFNKYIQEKDKETEEKILNTIAYSVFDNYDVNLVIFEIEGSPLQSIEKK